MNAKTDRVTLIRNALASLEPIVLDIQDDSPAHAHHAGAKSSGGGHFSITIISKAFEAKTPVRCHQMVYEALGDLINTEIHAISIQAKAP
jgi:BolA family transcriptional regulator, general stress-responsive regulator